MARVSALEKCYCHSWSPFFSVASSKARVSKRKSVFRLKREKERGNMLLAGHTSVINFCPSFVSEYVWAHMLDYKAM